MFIPVFNEHDQFLIGYAQKLIHNADSQVIVMDVTDEFKNNAEAKDRIRTIEQTSPNHIRLQDSGKTIDSILPEQQDLMIVSMDSWKKLVESKSLWLSDIPSTLIIADK